MSSIMRARSGLTRRSERLESIGVPLSSRRLLDLQCSGPDAPIVTPYRSPPRRLRTGGDARPSRESGFVLCPISVIAAHRPGVSGGWKRVIPDCPAYDTHALKADLKPVRSGPAPQPFGTPALR